MHSLKRILLATAASVALSTSAFAQATSGNISGHISVNGPQPTLSSCGTAPAGNAFATDTVTTVTTGSTSVSACTVTFAQPFSYGPPTCVVSAISSGGTPYAAGVSARSLTAVTFTWATAMTSGFLDYFCSGH